MDVLASLLFNVSNTISAASEEPLTSDNGMEDDAAGVSALSDFQCAAIANDAFANGGFGPHSQSMAALAAGAVEVHAYELNDGLRDILSDRPEPLPWGELGLHDSN